MNSPSAKLSLGLSFQPDQVSLVAMENGTIQGTAVRELVQPFDLETFRTAGVFMDGQDHVIRDLHRQIGKKGTQTGVVVHSGLVLVKKIPIALGLEQVQLSHQLKWETETFLVSAMEEYVVEYQRLPFQDVSGNPYYLLILLRKSVLAGIRSLLKQSDLILSDLDVDLFSVIRTILANYDLEFDDLSAIITLRRESVDFLFLRHREYFLSSRVLLVQRDAPQAATDAEEVVKIVLKELRRLIFGHRLGRGVEDLSRIFLLGSEKVQAVSQSMLASISVPLDIVNPFRRVKVSQTVADSPEFSRFPERFVASVGMTLKKTAQTQ